MRTPKRQVSSSKTSSRSIRRDSRATSIRRSVLKNAGCATLLTVIFITSLPAPVRAQAQQTPIPEKPSIAPQIELDGTGIATLEGHWPRLTLPGGGRSSTTRINVSDSALLLGASQRLFRNGGIGSFVIGGTTTETAAAPSGTNLFLHQLYLDYATPRLEASVGRTTTPTRLIDFPTLRGDDLNEFVNVLNPFSNGDNVEEHRFGDSVAITLNRGLRYFVNLHAQHLITSTPDSVGQGGINAYGVNLQYQGAPALEAIQRV